MVAPHQSARKPTIAANCAWASRAVLLILLLRVLDLFSHIE
jgi:hypothetical protein